MRTSASSWSRSTLECELSTSALAAPLITSNNGYHSSAGSPASAVVGMFEAILECREIPDVGNHHAIGVVPEAERRIAFDEHDGVVGFCAETNDGADFGDRM